MASNLYNIQPWSDTEPDYKEHDIVLDNGRYWYARLDHEPTTGNRPPTTSPLSSETWAGSIYIASVAEDRPFFEWLPDYNLQVSNAPRVHSIKFGDGYEQRITHGINNSLMNLPVTFNNRTEEETVAIAHFLADKEAKHPFYFRVPEPHNVIKKFVCKQWASTLVFENNFNTTATFEEVS